MSRHNPNDEVMADFHWTRPPSHMYVIKKDAIGYDDMWELDPNKPNIDGIRRETMQYKDIKQRLAYWCKFAKKEGYDRKIIKVIIYKQIEELKQKNENNER